MSEDAFYEYFPSWLIWLGTGRRFLPQPGGLDDQFDAQMHAFLELDSLYMKMYEAAKPKRTEDQ